VQSWAAQVLDTCDYAAVQSLGVDAAGDVYATGWCEPPGGADQMTVKYSGLDGQKIWAQHTAGDPDSYSPFLLSLGQGRVFVAATQEVVSGKPERRLITDALDSQDGHPIWTGTLEPSAGGDYALDVMATFSNGDALVSGGGIVARLNGATGSPRWSANSDYSTAVVLDGNQDPIFVAGNAVWKTSANSGSVLWKFVDPQLTAGFYAGLHDITLAADGSVFAAGTAYPLSNRGSYLHVVSVDPAAGTPNWTLNDLSAEYAEGFGIAVAHDGGILVSANYAVPDSSPWSLVRITGPFADGIFANGLEQ
jgi:hypothetical protein